MRTHAEVRTDDAHTMARRLLVAVLTALAAAGLALVGLSGAGAAEAEPAPPPEVLSIEPNHGPVTGGGTVTVTGSGFVAGLTMVGFDGEYLDVRVVSSRRLTFVMPPHDPGHVAMVVRTSERRSVGSVDYVVDPPAVIESPTAPVSSTPTPTATATGAVVTVDDPSPSPKATPTLDRPRVVRDEPVALSRRCSPRPARTSATSRSRLCWRSCSGQR